MRNPLNRQMKGVELAVRDAKFILRSHSTECFAYVGISWSRPKIYRYFMYLLEYIPYNV